MSLILLGAPARRIGSLTVRTASLIKVTSTQDAFLPARRYRLLSTRARAFQGTPRGLGNSVRIQHRPLSTSSTLPPRQYQACVVGAGPAGVTVLGNLLQRGVQPILWVDESFTAGRVNARYREVPSNTKVKLFTDFATAVTPFRDIVGVDETKAQSSDSLSMLQGLDPEKGCQLSHAADMILMLTEGLKKYPGVEAVQGRLTDATLDDTRGSWTVQVKPSDEGKATSTVANTERLILCTGSSPNNSPLPVHIAGIENVDLDTALSPRRLAEIFSQRSATVAVIGASHSAVLVLRNLYNLARSGQSDIKIKWFTRHGLRYAEYMDGWILRDNTGLKGEAATWAKENLEPETLPNSDVSKYIEKIAYKAGSEKEVFRQHLADANYYVQAIGFNKDPIPELSLSSGAKIQPQFDHDTGSFSFAEKASQKIKGLFGAGIAWPERVKDPYGNVEYAVGFFKFMKFVKRVSPSWN